MEIGENPTVIVEFLPVRGPDSVRRVSLQQGMTLDDLICLLELPANTEAVIVNERYVKPDYLLQDGDKISIIPFMAGG